MKIPVMIYYVSLLSTSACNFSKSCTNYLVWILGFLTYSSSPSSTETNKNTTTPRGKELLLGQGGGQEAKAKETWKARG